jgi:alginate O-acetyltransferase complex protein AlgI
MGVIPQTSFLLPIGISFFTFQAVSYVIDVYRGNPVQKNPIDLALYIAMFPQLIAGPIVRYETVAQQLKFRRESLPLLTDGVCRFLVGFNKKMLLANLFAICADRFFSLPSLSACGAWLGAIAYTFQIFFDFSGYSDMAIGLGLMFGFRFLENFDYPYISRSVTEFWRRWHMSLGSWFRDYLYFPLGGSRVATRSRLVFNLSVVWFATGFWHGANWTFMLWGALYGVLIIVEKLTGLPQKIESGRIWGCLGWLGTMFFVITGWVLFRADSLSSACVYLKSMFGFGTLGLIDDVAVFEARENLILLALGILCSAPLARSLKNRLPPGAESGHLAHLAKLANLLAQVALFFVSVSYLVMNAHNPFIYFNF